MGIFDINKRAPASGRALANDGSIRNWADAVCFCTNSIRTVDAATSEIFRGALFTAFIRFQLSTGAKRYLSFETPEATAENPVFVIWAIDEVKADVNNFKYTLWEGATFTGLTAQPVINANRNLQQINQAASKLWSEITQPTPGIATAEAIDGDTILGGTGAGQATTGGSASTPRFKILKPNTKYTLELHNDDGKTANVMVRSNFLEVELPELYAKIQ